MTIDLFKVFMAADATSMVSNVLQSGFIGQGTKVDEFEEELRSYFGNLYVNTLNSATSGLHLAIHLLKINGQINESDEILTTPLTCTASTFAILANNIKPKWVDIDLQTGNLDLNDLARKITPSTKAIMIVHWGGYPIDLSRLSEIQTACEAMHGFKPMVIEDCAHAWGATYKGNLLGNQGNINVFSLQAIKHVTSGDGGVLISPNDHLHRQAKLLRWYGLDRTGSADYRCEQNIENWGYKFHMNDICASIGISNLRNANYIVGKHRENGQYFNETLQGIPGIKLMENKPDRESSFWIYTMRVENRDDFKRKMKEKGIAVSQVHDRNDKHECVKEFRAMLPNMDILSKDMICLPCGWWVNNEDREYIVNCIKSGW